MIERFVGLMSGTSADGVDAVVAVFESGRFQGVEASYHLSHPAGLRRALVALGRDDTAQISLTALAELDVAVAEQFAKAAIAVMHEAGLEAAAVRAIGSHGQTIFHSPKQSKSSLQVGDPNRIAALTGLPVVADFRRMDIALGGEGAPLVPAFHQAVFASNAPTAVVNIGGIANLTLLTDALTAGYDCGPGNALMDEWAVIQLGTPHDVDGAFAARGKVIVDLLAKWLAEPYFQLPAPKSTGRSLFNLDWAKSLAGPLDRYAAADVQATLCELTASTIAAAIPACTQRVLVCGGGAFNRYLMARIAALKPSSASLHSTEVAGLPPQWVEAAAFAWLAHQRVHGLHGNVTKVTGASRPAVLGGLYG